MTDTLTRETADLVKTIFIQADPQQVWEYLTRKAHIGKWYQPAHGDLADGADYTLGKDGKRTVWGRVLVWTPPHRLVTTFNVGPLEGRETTVTWELKALAGGTQVTLTHTGIVPELAEECAILGHIDAGWDGHLASLRGLAA
ncbi:MAG: SRPBCC domain-containing protein [Pseudomonadota bacterium]